MNEIIRIENGVPVLDAETAANIAFFEKAIKDIKAQEDALRKSIMEAMESNRITKIKTDALTISYVPTALTEYFDKKKFQSENAELYDEYVTLKPQAAYIKITLAKGK